MQTIEPPPNPPGSEPAFKAAQYVRMSTEHQQYSTENQGDKILEYAARGNIEIVRTYADEGKSGLRIDGRQALQQLIKDVETGNADFQIILVYDVSRWGRFQDADESAYYEYICRRAGIQVAYCAEQFENDGSPVSTIVKGVKRAMAGEYSREPSAKGVRRAVPSDRTRLPPRRASGLRPAARADRPVRVGEGPGFARGAQEPANRPRDLAARPGCRNRRRQPDLPLVRRGRPVRVGDRQPTQHQGRSHRSGPGMDAGHSARGALEREIHRQQRLQPALLQAQEGAGRESTGDVDQEGRRVRGHRAARSVLHRTRHPARTRTPLQQRGIGRKTAPPVPAARLPLGPDHRRGRRHAVGGGLRAPLRWPDPRLPDGRFHAGSGLPVSGGQPVPAPPAPGDRRPDRTDDRRGRRRDHA